jgi:hypothetical protein
MKHQDTAATLAPVESKQQEWKDELVLPEQPGYAAKVLQRGPDIMRRYVEVIRMGDTPDGNVRIAIEEGEDTRIYHARSPIFLRNEGSVFMIRKEGRISSSFQVEHEKFNALANIPGVAEISVEKYSVTVRKARLYAWDEVGPEILRVLGAYPPPVKIFFDAEEGQGTGKISDHRQDGAI